MPAFCQAITDQFASTPAHLNLEEDPWHHPSRIRLRNSRIHYHWLLQPDKEIERPDLAAMSMTRNLKVDARAHRVRNLLGLMCEEKDRQRAVGFCEGGL